MRCNLSVGRPIDLLCDERDNLEMSRRRRFEEGGPYFAALGFDGSEGIRRVFRALPELRR